MMTDEETDRLQSTIDDARKAFGHVDPTISDEECLARRVWQLERFRDERNALVSANAQQAQHIARLGFA